jgi:hypothetical protein
MSAALLAFGIILVAWEYDFLECKPVDFVGIAISAFGPFALLHFAVFFIWYVVYTSIGCSAYTHTLGITMAFHATMAALSVVFTLGLGIFHGSDAQRVWWFFVGVLCCGHALYFIGLSGVSQTYFMVETELSKWRLDTSPVPVWLGEFGSNWRDNRLVWRNLLHYVKNHNLSFAYWPLNGLIWDNSRSAWIDESFGLLDQNYTSVRNPELVSFLFG